MKIAAFLYLVDILSHISFFLGLIALVVSFIVVIVIVVFITLSVYEYTDNDWYIFFVKHGKKIIVCWLCLLLLCAVIPRKELMYIAGGLYLGNEVLENPKVKTLVERSYRILDDKLNTILQKIEGVEK